TVYYTNLTLGRISFAVLEDRKFKSAPEGLVKHNGKRPDHIMDRDFDVTTADVPDAQLLGDRQLKFIERWSSDWTGCDMKAVLSQTIFCGGAHVHAGAGRVVADLDTNGWPQTGRNKALAAIRKAFAVHIAGDQHLGTVFHHGIDDWNDAGYSFCVPSIANLYLRWWDPEQPGQNRQLGMPKYTGEFLDTLGNKVTCWAAANPDTEPRRGDGHLTTRAAGFGVVRFNKKSRQITFECWPRNVNINDPATKQYPGWPITIDQQDNYGRKAAAWLPAIEVTGQDSPVVQIVDQAKDEVLYTIRIQGTSFRPKVFAKGKYTVRIGEGDVVRVFQDIEASTGEDQRNLTAKF
ncbi:MAG: hypothetical protein WBF93_12540, partial [Pirellulales bacterium]